MTQRQERATVHVLIFVVSGLLVFLGYQRGLRINLIPAEYVGYFVAALGVASMAGLNIWFKGALDPAKDSAANTPAEPMGSGRTNPGA